MVNVYASARILEFHYVTLSQVVVVSDYVSVRIIVPTWRRERVNSDGFSLQSVWQALESAKERRALSKTAHSSSCWKCIASSSYTRPARLSVNEGLWAVIAF